MTGPFSSHLAPCPYMMPKWRKRSRNGEGWSWTFLWQAVCPFSSWFRSTELCGCKYKCGTLLPACQPPCLLLYECSACLWPRRTGRLSVALGSFELTVQKPDPVNALSIHSRCNSASGPAIFLCRQWGNRGVDAADREGQALWRTAYIFLKGIKGVE